MDSAIAAKYCHQGEFGTIIGVKVSVEVETPGR